MFKDLNNYPNMAKLDVTAHYDGGGPAPLTISVDPSQFSPHSAEGFRG
jgi:hypothetical protein